MCRLFQTLHLLEQKLKNYFGEYSFATMLSFERCSETMPVKLYGRKFPGAAQVLWKLALESHHVQTPNILAHSICRVHVPNKQRLRVHGMKALSGLQCPRVRGIKGSWVP